MRVTRSAEALLSSSPTASTSSSFSAGFTDYGAQSSSSRYVICNTGTLRSKLLSDGWVDFASVNLHQQYKFHATSLRDICSAYWVSCLKYEAAISLEPEKYRHHLCILHLGGRRDRPHLLQWRRRWRRRSVRGRSRGAQAKASNAVIKYSSSLDGWDNEKEWSTYLYLWLLRLQLCMGPGQRLYHLS